MKDALQGGCLCGSVRYDTGGAAKRITICYCDFCQRATGSDRMILPVFARAGFEFTKGTPRVHPHISEGSGKRIDIHFCQACGTELAVTFERWPDAAGVYSGTLDDPAAISPGPGNSRHIFVGRARPGTLIPAGVECYDEHATLNDGTSVEPKIYEAPWRVPERG